MEGYHALDEFIENCKSKDLVKAKAVIDHLAEIDIGERNRILFELAKLDDEFSIAVLAYLKYKHPALMAEKPQLEELLVEKTSVNPSRLIKYIIEKPKEVTVFVELVEKVNFREALPALRQLLNQNESDELLLTILQVLGRMKDENAVKQIAELLSSDNELIQVKTIASLAAIDTKSAFDALYGKLGISKKRDEIILDTLKNPDSEQAINYLVRSLLSPHADIRLLGKSKLAELGTKAIPALAKALQENNPDLQIHTLNILMNAGDESAVKAVRQLLNSEPENANVRFAAFEALAYLPSLKGDYLLATGLTDKDDAIRLAAAKAIERNLDERLLQGVKNMVEAEDAEAVRIIKAIVDAEAGELFTALVEGPFFLRISTEYIALKVHQSTRTFFLGVLEKKGKPEIADTIKQISSARNSTTTLATICAVDDSAMILSVYRRVINELGYEPVLFEHAEQALFWLAENKPLAVFTDLNMPEITGIELSKRIREQYTNSDLPIIMVTTQEEGKDEQELRAAGINQLMNKPFDTESVKKILSGLSISP